MSHRDFVRKVLKDEVGLRAAGEDIVPENLESELSRLYRADINREGSASESVAVLYKWIPGGELVRQLGQPLMSPKKGVHV